MGRNDGLNDCKSKPGAACLIGHKRLKNVGLLFGCHAVAGDTDRKHNMIAGEASAAFFRRLMSACRISDRSARMAGRLGAM